MSRSGRDHRVEAVRAVCLPRSLSGRQPAKALAYDDEARALVEGNLALPPDRPLVAGFVLGGRARITGIISAKEHVPERIEDRFGDETEVDPENVELRFRLAEL